MGGRGGYGFALGCSGRFGFLFGFELSGGFAEFLELIESFVEFTVEGGLTAPDDLEGGYASMRNLVFERGLDLFESNSFEERDGHLLDEGGFGESAGLVLGGELLAVVLEAVVVFFSDDFAGEDPMFEGILGDGGLPFGSGRAGRALRVAAVGFDLFGGDGIWHVIL